MRNPSSNCTDKTYGSKPPPPNGVGKCCQSLGDGIVAKCCAISPEGGLECNYAEDFYPCD